jgi:hypothetical protein
VGTGTKKLTCCRKASVFLRHVDEDDWAVPLCHLHVGKVAEDWIFISKQEFVIIQVMMS